MIFLMVNTKQNLYWTIMISISKRIENKRRVLMNVIIYLIYNYIFNVEIGINFSQ